MILIYKHDYNSPEQKETKMANLHFHYGVMGAAKTANLLTTAFNLQQTGKRVEIIKPQRDNRFSDNEIVSRVGLRMPAMSLKNLDSYIPKPDTQFILIDEIQFFNSTDIDKLSRIANYSKAIIMCYGLMTDSNEHLFPASQRLVEVGAKLHLIESNCQIDGCMNMATHNARFDKNGRIITDGPQIAVGADQYKSVCRMHFERFKRGMILNEIVQQK